MKKCITIHVLLGNIRPRFRYRKMQILWTFAPQVAGGGGGGACSTPSTQMYCAMTDGHCMLCPDQETESMTGGAAIIPGASPAASLPPRHCPSWLLHIIYAEKPPSRFSLLHYMTPSSVRSKFLWGGGGQGGGWGGG